MWRAEISRSSSFRAALTALALALLARNTHGQRVGSTPSVSTTVTVVGSPEPVTLGETNRATVVLDTEHPQAFSQLEDYLRTDASTFIEQRGAGGSQADISIRGTSFEQTLILLNGLRITDPETSHNNLDIPVPLPAIHTIDVLHGAGSTLYGSDAIGGVVDLVTAEPTASSLVLQAGGGNFGTYEQAVMASVAARGWSEMISGERDSSAGFMVDRDYRDEELSSETRWSSRLGASDLLLASDDRAFGANQFYGDYPSYERTKGWFASANQSLGKQTQVAFGFRRHTDQYLLVRSDPSLYENNHVDTSWETALRRVNLLGKHVRLFYGAEGDGDGIHSNNLGNHARSWGAGYLDTEVRWQRGSLTAGIRQEIISGGYRATSPMLALGQYVSKTLKFRAEGGYGFRLPTYLDLYYSDPVTIGNPELKPESAWNFEGGMDWFCSRGLFVSSTLFYSRQHDAIDYVRADSSSPWKATNLAGLRFVGWENRAVWQPVQTTEFTVSWTLLAGAQQALQGLQSEYVFNYPINNASLEVTHTWKDGLTAHTRLGVTQRYERAPYAVWDASVARERGMLQPYLRVSNVTNTGYQEVLNVQMPGRTAIAGIVIRLSRRPVDRK